MAKGLLDELLPENKEPKDIITGVRAPIKIPINIAIIIPHISPHKIDGTKYAQNAPPTLRLKTSVSFLILKPSPKSNLYAARIEDKVIKLFQNHPKTVTAKPIIKPKNGIPNNRQVIIMPKTIYTNP